MFAFINLQPLSPTNPLFPLPYLSESICSCNVISNVNRKFKGIDVPSSLVKTVPDFCSVFVVSKGKLVTARSAQRPVVNSVTPPKQIPSYGPEENGARYLLLLPDTSI